MASGFDEMSSHAHKHRYPSPVVWAARVAGVVLVLLALGGGVGCSKPSATAVRPDAPGLSADERDMLQNARRAVAQHDGWGDQAEFKFERRDGGWRVTAWKVVHPKAHGDERYVPWESRRLTLDRTGKVTEYGSNR